MENAPTEQEMIDMKKKLGLDGPRQEPLQNSLFQGDFGFSIDLSSLIAPLILFLVVAVLIVYAMKKIT